MKTQKLKIGDIVRVLWQTHFDQCLLIGEVREVKRRTCKVYIRKNNAPFGVWEGKIKDIERSIPNSERRNEEYSKSGTRYCDADLRFMRKKNIPRKGSKDRRN